MRNKFIFRIARSDEDSEYVATCDQYPSLSWLDINPFDALNELMNLVFDSQWEDQLADMRAEGSLPSEAALDEYADILIENILSSDIYYKYE